MPQTSRFQAELPVTVADAEIRERVRDHMLHYARRLTPGFQPQVKVDAKGVRLFLTVPAHDEQDARMRAHYWARRIFADAGVMITAPELRGVKVRVQ